MAFVLSKVLWALLAPLHILCFFLVFGVLAFENAHQKVRRLARAGLYTSVAFLFLVMIFPIGDWALLPLENATSYSKPTRVDGIILLAGDEQPFLTHERGIPSLGSTAERYVVFAQLAREFQDVPLVFVGGSPSLNRAREVVSFPDIAKMTFTRMGLPEDRLYYEGLSRNTFENAVNAAQLMKPTQEQNWILVTSAFHMPRSVLCFQKAGWNVTPYPMDFKTSGNFDFGIRLSLLQQLNLLNTAVREYIGLIAYWMMGRIERIWP